MKRIILIYILLIFIFSPFLSRVKDNPYSLLAQNDTIPKINKTSIDTVITKKKSDLDTIVNYKASDSLTYNIKTKSMRLKSNAQIDYKVQKLNADIITINFDNSTLTSSSDTTKEKSKRTYPKFADGTQSFIGSNILYNFKTNQGTISTGETEITDGFYYGTKIKRVSENELFIQDGCYTTCNHPHPHYYFGSPKMKVIVKDKIFIDPIIFYVEDVPLFILPVGLYFPNKSGRQSGLIIPSPYFSNNRGVSIEDFGYYFALSDYYDTQIKASFYSKGGFTLKNFTRFKKKYSFSGNVNLEYGKTRYSPDDEYTSNWKLGLNYNQTITPQSNIVANLNFSSSDYNRNTTNNFNSRITQYISSNADYTESFDNGSSFSISYSRNQNIITNTYDQTMPRISYSLPNINPLKNLIKPTSSWSWLRDVSFSYSGNAIYSESKSKLDSDFVQSYKTKIVHSPRISISPKLGHFTINPYFDFSFNNYFRQVDYTFDNTDSSKHKNFRNGFFTEYNYRLGFDVSTVLWGVAKPKIFGINSIRHKLTPKIGFSYTPDLSDPKYGFYSKYVNPITNTEEIYSRYAEDDGGIASRSLQNNITYSLGNTFDIGIKQDSGNDKRVSLLNLTISGSYNLAADSLKMRDISMSFSVPQIAGFNLSGYGAFTPYAEEFGFIPGTKKYGYRLVNKLLLDQGRGLLMMKNFSVNLNTSFTDEGISIYQSKQDKNDSVSLGDRFNKRVNYEEDEFDNWGDNSSGYSPLRPKWNLSLGINYSYSRLSRFANNESFNIRANYSMSITQTWALTASASYDFINKELQAPMVSLTKTLHCWDLMFDWYPSGINRGFYLRFAISAPQLQDLKIEKRRNPLDY